MRTLSLINMISSYFDYHLSFVSDMLNLFIIKYWRIRASIEVLFVHLDLYHAVVNAVSVIKSRLFSASGQLVESIIKLRFFWKWYEDWHILSGCARHQRAYSSIGAIVSSTLLRAFLARLSGYCIDCWPCFLKADHFVLEVVTSVCVHFDKHFLCHFCLALPCRSASEFQLLKKSLASFDFETLWQHQYNHRCFKIVRYKSWSVRECVNIFYQFLIFSAESFFFNRFLKN